MLGAGHGAQHVVERCADFDGDDVVAGHHDLADGDEAEIEHTVNHVLLEFGQVPKAAAGTHDEFELLGRMAGAG